LRLFDDAGDVKVLPPVIPSRTGLSAIVTPRASVDGRRLIATGTIVRFQTKGINDNTKASR
jgi:hypothetical protein